MKGWIVERDSKRGRRYQAKARVPDPGRRKGYRDISRTFGRKRDAENWLAQTVTDVQRGTLVLPATATVSELLDLWLESVIRPRVRAGSFRVYERYVRLHLKPGLGRYRVQSLSPAMVQSWYMDRLAAGVSARTVAGCHTQLVAACNAAVDWGILASNPCGRVKPPAHRVQKFGVWTPEQGASFLSATEGRRFHALWVMALATGMRMGELRGLRWADVDLDRRVVQVHAQLEREGGEVKPAPLKTMASRRSITLPVEAVAALRQHRVRQLEQRLAAGARWRDHDVVFASSVGTPFDHSWLGRKFHEDLAIAGAPRIRIHDLRHSHATWLLQAGVPVKVVSERLGHASVGITLNTYAHVMPGMQERAADVVQEVLFGAG